VKKGAQDILIDVSPGETRAAWIDEAGVLQRFEIDRISMPSLVGGLYLGRVRTVEKGMNAAFVDIGVAEDALLRHAKGVTEGERVIVEVTHDAGIFKGPTVTRHPSVIGRYLRYRPDQKDLMWSRGLGHGKDRARLEKELRHVLPHREGFFVRTSAREADAEGVAAEVAWAKERWAGISARAKHQKTPAELVSPPGLIDRVLRDHTGPGRIVIDDRLAFGQAKKSEWTRYPGLRQAIEPYDREEPLYDASGVTDQLAEAIVRVVPLAGGGNLVIDRTEAMMVIDVNLGDAAHRRPRDDAVYTLNLAAVGEVARHIRVRNMSGLIVVDFITMRTRGHRQNLVKAMRAALGGDWVHCDVLGLTAGGVIEITRQRAGRSLAEFYERPHGKGTEPHPHAAALHGLRHALRLKGAGRPVLRADPSVITVLEGPLRPALDETARRMGQPLDLRPDPGRMEPDLFLERQR